MVQRIFTSAIFLIALLLSNQLHAGENRGLIAGFVQNKGQVSDQDSKPRQDIFFSGQDGLMSYHLRNNGVSYYQHQLVVGQMFEPLIDPEIAQSETRLETYRVDVTWLGSNTNSLPSGLAPLPGITNYYLPSCEAGALGVQSFARVQYANIYTGFDLAFYQTDGHLEYDFIGGIGADPGLIRFQYAGQTALYVDGVGQLVVETPFGKLTEHRPLVTQAGRQLQASWKVVGAVASIEIPNIDANLPFVIDPVVRAWATYLGGTATDIVRSSAADGLGNVTIVGSTASNAPAVFAPVGAFQATYGGGLQDAFITKFDGNGNRVWSTYFGRTLNDEALDCDMDTQGNVVVTGVTQPSQVGTLSTPGAYQPAHGGGAQDAFLAKFDPNGAVIWSTFYGDQGDDVGHTCNLDQNGNVFVCGYTSSQASMSSPGAHQSTLAGTGDGFVAKFNSAGQRLWGSYFGGPRVDRVYACAADPNGAVLVAGRTDSLSNGSGIATVGCHQPTCGLGTYDAFLAKFDSNGVREWGTYYGGSAADEGRAVDTDAQGNVYLAGHTYSTSAISTNNAHQPSNGGGQDGFLAKFDPSGQRLWGTYYGGTAGDPIYGLVVDTQGRVFISGHTSSSNAIATPGAYQTVYNFADDAYVAEFDGNGIRQWGTYYGESQQDWLHSVCVDANGDLFAAGTTQSTTMMASPGAFQSTFGGGFGDALLVKFGLPLSIESDLDSDQFGLLAYPNPATHQVTLSWQEADFESPLLISVENTMGQLVFQGFAEPGARFFQIPTEKFATGCYFATARFESGAKTVKILKQGN